MDSELRFRPPGCAIRRRVKGKLLRAWILHRRAYRERREAASATTVVAKANGQSKTGSISARSKYWATVVGASRLIVLPALFACSSGADSSSPAPSDSDLGEVGRGGLAEETPSRTVTDFLEALPTELWFYVLVGGLVLGLASRHWFLARSLNSSIREHRENKDNRLSGLDWWVIGELRRRALRLRARANWVLFFVLALLFGGLYVVFFVLSQVLENERLQAERLRSEVFKARFEEQLEGLVQGIHWVAVDDAKLGPAIDETGEGRAALVKRMEGPMRPRGGWTGVGFSSDGSIALIGDRAGSALVRRESGDRWERVELELRSTEWVSHASFSSDGATGLVVGDEGSVFATEDRGRSWLPRPRRSGRSGWSSSLVVSGDGAAALATDDSSVLLTRDIGETWNALEVGLRPGEAAAYTALSDDGEVGLVVGVEGSVVTTGDGGSSWFRRYPSGSPSAGSLSGVTLSEDASVGLVARGGVIFLTRDIGETWTEIELQLGPGEGVALGALSADGTTGLIVGSSGSILRTGDAGVSWARPDFSGESIGEPSAVALSGNGSIGVVADDDGTVLVSRDAGEVWTRVQVGLMNDEWASYVALSASGEKGLMVGTRGSVLSSDDGGRVWRAGQADLPLIAFSANGTVALARDHEDRLFLTDDAGEKWRALSFRLPGRLTAAAVDAEGRTAVVANEEGSAYVSWDGGRHWDPTSAPDGELDVTFLEAPARILATSRPPLLSLFSFEMNEGKEQFLLERHTALAGWQSKSSSSILNALRQSSTLQNSEIHRSMRQFLVDYDARAFLEAEQRASASSTAGNEKGASLGDIFSDLRIIQAATLTILFFLVQTLSRLHRYSLRLAAFWESRSDSVLLAQGRSDMKFEDLVRSLAPDSYDFRASAQTPLQSLFSRRKT